MSPTGSVVVDLNIEQSRTNVSSQVAGYGIYVDGGNTRGKLVFINYSNSTAHDFILPAGIAQQIGLRMLQAPSVNEQTAISWAGQTVGQNGNLEGTQTTYFGQCKDGCTVTVSGPGAVLVQLDSFSAGMRPAFACWFVLAGMVLVLVVS